MEEGNLSNMPKSVSFELLKKLSPLLKTNICQIECKDGKHGTGFFVLFLMVGIL
jgi:hypothetical protein